ncbi:ASCH domain-containing protein [Gordonia sp. MP11Mi]|uniref:ASCH domain-containing protein n=1 Tax=Gordonia sp. MP11Mi TaxID=3022769 RepID=A0AA97CU71_9ACTN
MLISKAVAEGIREGRITCQFRRWDAPRVKVGGTQLTPAGVIRFTRVARVSDVGRISDRSARAAGMRNAEALRKALSPTPTRAPTARGSRGGDTVYRITLEWAGADPRIALRESIPDADDLEAIAAKLARLDRRSSGPWTRDILEWIRDNPRVVSKELAALRDLDLLPMKVDIRKLKSLGLTISHDVGYEISPRGAAYLDWLEAGANSR